MIREFQVGYAVRVKNDVSGDAVSFIGRKGLVTAVYDDMIFVCFDLAGADTIPVGNSFCFLEDELETLE